MIGIAKERRPASSGRPLERLPPPSFEAEPPCYIHVIIGAKEILPRIGLASSLAVAVAKGRLAGRRMHFHRGFTAGGGAG
jgi:hypothetical protein